MKESHPHLQKVLFTGTEWRSSVIKQLEWSPSYTITEMLVNLFQMDQFMDVEEDARIIAGNEGQASSSSKPVIVVKSAKIMFKWQARSVFACVGHSKASGSSSDKSRCRRLRGRQPGSGQHLAHHCGVGSKLSNSLTRSTSSELNASEWWRGFISPLHQGGVSKPHVPMPLCLAENKEVQQRRNTQIWSSFVLISCHCASVSAQMLQTLQIMEIPFRLVLGFISFPGHFCVVIFDIFVQVKDCNKTLFFKQPPVSNVSKVSVFCVCLFCLFGVSPWKTL